MTSKLTSLLDTYEYVKRKRVRESVKEQYESQRHNGACYQVFWCDMWTTLKDLLIISTTTNQHLTNSQPGRTLCLGSVLKSGVRQQLMRRVWVRGAVKAEGPKELIEKDEKARLGENKSVVKKDIKRPSDAHSVCLRNIAVTRLANP